MDEIGIWNRALSSSEVTTLYNSGAGVSYPFGSTTNYTLTATSAPTGGGTVILSPSGGTYASGTSVTATANANSGYTFTGWSGALTGTTNPGTVIMNSDKTLTANFTAITTYSLTITTPTNGTVNASPVGPNYASGTTVTLTATPSSGYQFSSWSGSLTGSTNPATILMNGNKTVSATFTQLPAGSDNLGNHIATQNIRLSNFWLSNDGGNEGIKIDNNGNAGIGIANNPNEKFDVNGNLLLRNSSNVADAGAYIHFSSYADNCFGPKIRSSLIFANGSVSKSKLILSSYWEGYKDELTLLNGNVGIGTYNPSSKLTVNGKILAKEVEVVSYIASDYVFEPDYALMPLTELELYLRKNKHLPGIPSVLEFQKKGQNLGEMDDMLLRKIEELTLYIIEQKKLIEELQKEIDVLIRKNK